MVGQCMQVQMFPGNFSSLLPDADSRRLLAYGHFLWCPSPFCTYQSQGGFNYSVIGMASSKCIQPTRSRLFCVCVCHFLSACLLLAAPGWVKTTSHVGMVVVCLEDFLLSVHVLISKEQQQGGVSREAWQPTSSSRDSPWQLVI